MKLRCLLVSAMLCQAASAVAAPASALSRSPAPASTAPTAPVPVASGNVINIPSMGIAFTAPPNWSHKIKRVGRFGEIVVDPVEENPRQIMRCQIKPMVEPRTRALSQEQVNARMRANPATPDQFAEMLTNYVDDPGLTTIVRDGGDMLADERLVYWYTAKMSFKLRGQDAFYFMKLYVNAVPGFTWVVACGTGSIGEAATASAQFTVWSPDFDRLVSSMRFSSVVMPPASASHAAPPPSTTTRARVPSTEPVTRQAPIITAASADAPLPDARHTTNRPTMSERQAGASALPPVSAGRTTAPAPASRDVQPYSGYGFAIRAPQAADRSIMDSTIVQEALAQGCKVRKPPRQIVISRNAGPLNLDEIVFPQGCFGTRTTPPLYGVGTVQAPARDAGQYLVFDYDDQARERLIDYLNRQ